MKFCSSFPIRHMAALLAHPGYAKRRVIWTAAFACAALVLPMAAFADVSGTPHLHYSEILSLDTGEISTSSNPNFAGEVQYNAIGITDAPGTESRIIQAFVVGNIGAAGFDSLTLSDLAKYTYNQLPLFVINQPGAPVVAGTVIAYQTFGGHYSKVLVVAIPPLFSDASITLDLKFTTFTGNAYTCGNSTPPVITSVDSASSYGGYPYFASGSWLEIKGTNLADPNDPRLTASVNPGQWSAGDFSGVNAPTTLDGISVIINAKRAYIWYLSPGQINVQAPEDSITGNVSITVINCKAASNAFTFARRALAPGLLAPSSFNVGGKQYMVATFNSDGAYVLNTGAVAGINSRPAKPGDLIVAYGVGFGDVAPSILPGVIVQQSNSLSNPVAFSFGSTHAALSYSGLAGNFVGLYEFYITVPSGLANGDYQINVTQNGTSIPQTMYLTVHN